MSACAKTQRAGDERLREEQRAGDERLREEQRVEMNERHRVR
jgi:hypothetical protein